MTHSSTTATLGAHGQEAPGSHGHAHPPYLAHHFQSLKQQYDSGKFGMWVFLATEILMFGGLFCAYSVYRANHPEVFLYAHHFLDKNLGALNTVILLASSFTMAWAVRAAQLGQKRLLVALLALTFAGGVGFMVIKTIEYHAKWEHLVWVGPSNAFYTVGGKPANPELLEHVLHHGEAAEGAEAAHHASAGGEHEGSGAAAQEATGPGAVAVVADHSVIEPPASGPAGLIPGALDQTAAQAGHGTVDFQNLPPQDQQRVHLFFQIYFLMTGLHGIHVLVGMGLIGYLAVRAMLGHFSAAYFMPVDIIGLYWHLVDLIWIFLFPLLYLIH
ncbi:MAG TPA: cytochrome c oxidase subunit 3 [Phycisphaeraceae bacterium]